ncbi:hypothetical protein BV25DRAFT_1841665 [Artomyces pyxidatus]|uniref:Uncharacterized protein n=1 Tax=Artomyces pyxidatus TaxID=48021 RepID=A0ACB8SM48_9AGAM|nr:hypothetical protein BV25DRAFT_1841665 [Artomyces pyxidatus]
MQAYGLRDADPPFNDIDADIILRSSDKVDFHVHKLFLSKASPFFRDMVSLPQTNDSFPVDEARNGLFVLPLEEDASAIDMMLRFCYPRSCCPEEPHLDGFDDLKHAMQMASKYQLDVMERAVLLRLEVDPEVQHPERLYATAWALGLRDVVLAAAKLSLRHPRPVDEEFEEFDDIPATALIRFLDYRRRCVDAVVPIMTDFSWFHGNDIAEFLTKCSNMSCLDWNINVDNGVNSIKKWWWDYIETVKAELAVAPSKWAPAVPKLLSSAIEAAAVCPDCRASHMITPAMTFMCKRLSEEIELRISKVELKTPF